MLRVMSVCSRSLNQLKRRYDFAVPVRMATNGSSRLQMAHLPMLVQWIFGGVNWKVALFLVMNVSTSCEDSLSGLCSCG